MARRGPCTGASAVLVVLAALVPLRAEGRDPALLLVRGPPELARPLERELRRGELPLLSAGAARARLAAAPAARRALSSAHALLNSAWAAVHHMRRAAALDACAEALAALDAAGARFFAAREPAQAHAVEALASLLRPRNAKAAELAYRRAVGVDPSFEADPDRTPPAAKRLLGRARASPVWPAVPTRRQLAAVARAARVGRVIWSRVIPRGAAGVELQLVDYGAGRVQRSWRRRLPRGDFLRRGVRLVLPRSRQRLARVRPPPRAPAPVRPRPWYRRWWVWTLAGVVVGAAVGVTVGLATRDRSYTLEFRY